MIQSKLSFIGASDPVGGLHPPMMSDAPSAIFKTELGSLYQGDCLSILPFVKHETVDTVFADPPFNLGKTYGEKVDDNRNESEYMEWCKLWIDQCIRALKPGGSFFLYNIPKWNILLGAYLMERGLTFRHWIAVSIKFGLPISGRLYPAHYSLLYYSKGKPKTFRSIRTPIQICRHCGGEVKDYGGHRGAMNPNGVNLMDVWDDITPVRHWKFKSKKRKTNQLSTKILYRVIALSTETGDLVLDPFGGSGTTFDVSERMGRRWIGTELENCDVIIERLSDDHLHPHECSDWIEGDSELSPTVSPLRNPGNVEAGRIMFDDDDLQRPSIDASAPPEREVGEQFSDITNSVGQENLKSVTRNDQESRRDPSSHKGL